MKPLCCWKTLRQRRASKKLFGNGVSSSWLGFSNDPLRGNYIPAWNYAIAHMRQGDLDQALSFVAKAAEEPNWFALQLQINPMLDPLRGDPRFSAIAEKKTSAPASRI